MRAHAYEALRTEHPGQDRHTSTPARDHHVSNDVPTRKTAAAKQSRVRIAVPAPKSRKTVARPPADADDSAPANGAFAHLSPTPTPGVFLNKDGSLVDGRGVRLSFLVSKEAEDELSFRIIGEVVDTPAKLLKRVALDTSLPMMVRLDAAKAAAPYFDRKTPVAVENRNEDWTLDAAVIAALPVRKRLEILELLRTIGIDLGPTR